MVIRCTCCLYKFYSLLIIVFLIMNSTFVCYNMMDLHTGL